MLQHVTGVVPTSSGQRSMAQAGKPWRTIIHIPQHEYSPIRRISMRKLPRSYLPTCKFHEQSAALQLALMYSVQSSSLSFPAALLAFKNAVDLGGKQPVLSKVQITIVHELQQHFTLCVSRPWCIIFCWRCVCHTHPHGLWTQRLESKKIIDTFWVSMDGSY